MSEEPSQQSADLAPQRELVDYFYLFLERSWIIVIFLIAAGIYAQYQLRRTPETYQATATIEVERDLKAVGNITEQQRYRSQTDLVTVVSQKLNLDSLFVAVAEQPQFKDQLPDPATTSPEEYESAKLRLAKSLNARTTPTMRPRSTLIDIQTVHTDPQIAKDILDGMLEAFDQLGTESRQGESTANLEFLTKEIDRIRKNLSGSEQSLVIYKEAFRIREEMQKSDALVSEMEKKYLEKWPPLVQEKAHLEQLRKQFSAELQRITESSESEYEFWASHADKMSQLSGTDLVAYQIRTAEARNNMINRDFQTESSLYDSLLAQVKRGGVESEFDQSEFKIVQPAYANKNPIGPIPMKFYVRYGILGLGAGFLIAFLLGMMDSTVRRIEDLERISNAPVFAAVPKSGKLKDIPLDSNSPAAEAFRSLHASLLLSNKEAKTLLVTSSIPGEGKSTVSSNLAATAASQGEQVLLIDLDLRRPKVQTYLGLDPKAKGVNDCLSGQCSIDEAIQSFDKVDGFDVMTAGQLRLNNKLPDDAKISQLLERLETKYDRIILDTAPILAVSDTMLMAKHVDAVCLVFRMWKTPRKAVIRALGQLSNNGTYPIGLVSNFMPSRKGFGQYGYYYSYSGGGYGSYS